MIAVSAVMWVACPDDKYSRLALDYALPAVTIKISVVFRTRVLTGFFL